MSETAYAFDSSGVPPAKPREAMPTGWYRMWISSHEMQRTKSGHGTMLVLDFVALDGEHEGRHAWARLNVVNPSKEAQDIAQRELSAICHATGVLKFRDPSELYHRPMLVKLVKVNDPQYGEKNEVKGYKECNRTFPANFVPAGGRPPAARAAAGPAPAPHPADAEYDEDEPPF